MPVPSVEDRWVVVGGTVMLRGAGLGAPLGSAEASLEPLQPRGAILTCDSNSREGSPVFLASSRELQATSRIASRGLVVSQQVCAHALLHAHDIAGQVQGMPWCMQERDRDSCTQSMASQDERKKNYESSSSSQCFIVNQQETKRTGGFQLAVDPSPIRLLPDMHRFVCA